MTANTRIGEVGINWSGREYVLRPSFRNIQSLDDPQSYYENASECLAAYLSGITPAPSKLQMCAAVLDAMSPELLPEKLTGIIVISKDKGGLRWKAGAMTIKELCVIAHGLLKHGLYGKPSRDRTELARLNDPEQKLDGEPFDILPFVGMTIAPNGLGMSPDAAWDLTMIEFQAAIEMQFPISEKDKKRIPPPPEVMKVLQERANTANDYMKNKPKRRAQKLGA